MEVKDVVTKRYETSVWRHDHLLCGSCHFEFNLFLVTFEVLTIVCRNMLIQRSKSRPCCTGSRNLVLVILK